MITSAQKGSITRAINNRSEIRNGKLVLAGAVAMEKLIEVDPVLAGTIIDTQADPTHNDALLPLFWHVVDIGFDAWQEEIAEQRKADEAQAVIDAEASAARQAEKAAARAAS
jgi:hypothetical protein